MPSTELVQFRTADGLTLSGLWFEPRRARSVVVWTHGLGGSIFDSRRTNPLAAAFAERRIAFFPFNNRGAHGALEILRDCVHDFDGAIREARRRGFHDITLVGHSTGANKIAVYDHYKRRNFAKRYVMLAGGDDTGGLYRELGPRRFAALLRKARAKRRSNERWRALYDMANPNGDYNVFPFNEATRGRRPFRFVSEIRKPALYVYGEADEFGFDAALLAENIGANGEIVVMRAADHGFHGREAELATLIGDWIT